MLTDEQIYDIAQPHLPKPGHTKIWEVHPICAMDSGIEDKDARWIISNLKPEETLAVARAIEAEVRKQDEALIRQMLEAISDLKGYRVDVDAAARARLGEGGGV
jgi:hypothetical protein